MLVIHTLGGANRTHDMNANIGKENRPAGGKGIDRTTGVFRLPLRLVRERKACRTSLL